MGKEKDTTPDVEKTFDELFPKKDSYDVLAGSAMQKWNQEQMEARRLREIFGVPDPTTVKTFGFAFVVVYLLQRHPVLTLGTILFFLLFWSFFVALGGG